MSSYANTATRNGKPFNPLLGETFECDRMEDLGWRCIAEQVRDKLHFHIVLGAIGVEKMFLFLNSILEIFLGESSSTHTGNACRGCSGLEIVAGIYHVIQIPWKISSNYSTW